ncbi:helix-turn-helix transcriptional regulator [Amycolatopsis sp. cmx-4-68]|uniref:helix-turn-helix transcriptional regulator n=1 Tax=Amycolatopsis sp. cmx-4-68 TaxID=2790938 RepID=UPI00397CD593
MFAGFGGAVFGGPGHGHFGDGGHLGHGGLFGHPRHHVHPDHGEAPGGRGHPDHGSGGLGHPGHPHFGHGPGGHGRPGHPGHPGHEHDFSTPGHEDWDGGPDLARGGPPGGFPPPPPHPPQPPGVPGGPGGFPGFPGGPGSFGGPGGWGGGGPWQRVREFRGGRPAARPVRPAVLALLAEEPRHGYQLMQEIRRRTHDRWRPSPGSVYPILQQLEDEGLVHTAETGGRRVAELTDAGREHVAGREAEFAALWEEPEDEPGADRFAALWHALGELSGAAAQVGHSGTEAQVAEVKKILADARRRVYAVLADAGLEDED